MFDTVLVANRGEIAVRVIRTLRALGIRSVAVYSDADADARHVTEADRAVRLGPAQAAKSYLSIERVLAAAAETGADAIHPGYGFLSENADFARACAQAGIVFVGPTPAAIETMGDKISAKRAVEAAGVPVVPGRTAPGLSDDDLVDAAGETGFPLLLKPSAGGGGKGMRLVDGPGALREEIAAARRAARGAFGDDTLMIERFVDAPRHIEIQILADAHGRVIHLGERECSLQRRHQKIIEEAPSPLLDGSDRARLGDYAVKAAQACGYTGAGTVEFIADARSGQRYFLEMNTRLQVEHPVTEMITGLDLVEWQLRVAAGEPLGLGQEDVSLHGHAIEARVYAEDAARGFLPTGGRVLRLREPELPHVRVDSGLNEGTEVGSTYDPMLAKVIAHGPDRPTALRRLRAALAETTVLGVETNTGFLRRLLAHPDVAAGALDTGLVDRAAVSLVPREVPEEVYAAVALLRQAALEPLASVAAPGATDAGWTDPFSVPSGWRLGGEPAWTVHHLRVPGHDPVVVRVRGHADDAQVCVGAGESRAARLAGESGTGRVRLEWDGVSVQLAHAAGESGAGHWLGRDGDSWHIQDHDPVAAALRGGAGAHGADALTAPMPGTVTVVKAAAGDKVTAGQSLLVVEAMKMEHVITSPCDGTVTELDVTAGSTVVMDQVLAVVEPLQDPSGTEEKEAEA